MSEQASPTIDRQWCQDWVSEQVFRLRPRDYCLKHPKWPGMVGIEVEMHCFWRDSLASNDPQAVPLFGERSLSQALLALKASQPQWRFESMSEDPNRLMSIQLEEGDQISFEPGGQLEISSRPYPCLDDALSRVKRVTRLLSEHLESCGIALLQIGLNPWFDAERLDLQMTKPRYQAMNEYFNRIGPYGRQMMRLTCTIQVNLDFGEDDQVLAKRFLAANLLSPLATAIFAYSAIGSGKPNGYKSYRSRIWRGLDKSRTGFPNLLEIKKYLSKDACVAAYLDRIMKAQVVFIEKLAYKTPDTPLCFEDWLEHGYQGVKPTERDFQTHLSLFFPEVRARGFLELRSVDVQSSVWQMVPACFFTALLYDDANLDQIIDRLPSDEASLQELWQQSSYGLADSRLRALSVEVMKMALDGFSRLPSCYQGKISERVFTSFAEHFTLQGRSPADDLLDLYQQQGHAVLRPETMTSLETGWQNTIDKTQRT